MACNDFSKDTGSYTCNICGSAAQKIDANHVKCSFCGQVMEISGPKVEFGENKATDTTKKGHGKKSNPVSKVLIAVVVIAIVNILAGAFVPLILKYSKTDMTNLGIMKDFYEDVFGKPYKEITDEEFASIKYISYHYQSNGGNGESYHVLEYSFADYEDCESAEAFDKTIEEWSINSRNKSWPSDFTALTGLTRFDNYNASWLSQFQFSPDCRLTCILTSDSLDTISKTFNPETIKILYTDSSVTDYENLSRFTNLEQLCMTARDENVDLSGIENCTKLKCLMLDGKLDASSYEYLGKLPNLQVLDVRGLSLKYCSFLEKGCPNLVELHIADTEDGDISLLKNAPNLKRLYFSDNEEGDARILSELGNLKSLGFCMTSQEDLNELSKLTNLTSLSVRDAIFGMSDQDLSGLGNIPNLTELSVTFNLCGRIYGLESVLNKPGMTSLAFKGQFSDTDIMLDVDRLTENADLITLDIQGWELKNAVSREKMGFDFLQNYPSLKYLYLVESNVENLDFATALFNLKTLDVQENEIVDYSPLDSCRKLTELYVYGNPSTNPKLALSRVTVYKNRTRYN